ncbi:MAG: hypothetical protein H6907_15460 [Hyphomicrobiales bacterium]|nr:hypothetical protein [Hyphomicrobiales bacterium]MCP5373123.1 hypothetical protein [Hyphomicrobiales bacterium]
MIKRLTLAAAAGALMIAAGVAAQAGDADKTAAAMTPQQHVEMMRQHHEARMEEMRALHTQYLTDLQAAYRKLAETAPYATPFPTRAQMQAHADAQKALADLQMDYQARLYGMPSPKAIETGMDQRRAAWKADVDARNAAMAKDRDARRAAWEADSKRLRDWQKQQEAQYAPWMAQFEKQQREFMDKQRAEMEKRHQEMRAWHDKQRAARFGAPAQDTEAKTQG